MISLISYSVEIISLCLENWKFPKLNTSDCSFEMLLTYFYGSYYFGVGWVVGDENSFLLRTFLAYPANPWWFNYIGALHFVIQVDCHDIALKGDIKLFSSSNNNFDTSGTLVLLLFRMFTSLQMFGFIRIFNNFCVILK